MSSFSQLDSRQTRRMLLAGSVPLPGPFPRTALVRLVLGSLTRACGERPADEWFVVIHEQGDLGRAITRHVRASDVAAIFVPAEAKPKSNQTAAELPPPEHGAQEAAAEPRAAEVCSCPVDDLDRGQWALEPDPTSEDFQERLAKSLEVDLADPKSCVQAIVFVPKHAPVYTVMEQSQTAGAVFSQKSRKRAWAYCSSCN